MWSCPLIRPSNRRSSRCRGGSCLRRRTRSHPYIADRGYEVEFHVETAPFETWKVDGMAPPPPETVAERHRFEENLSLQHSAEELSNDSQVATA
ncbi:tautomerase family protein [Nocardioides sp. NPDC006273]|uniref:tautomerase family protein n=1 Tax=Nocardioides sp. NPDC006273 TaxID=3155598 RepID=UPI0033B8691F